MSRPSVSVVMPFAGDADAARAALESLGALHTTPGDELILADNAGTAPPTDKVTVVQARGEQSPAHARNAGAARATNDWILFLDADCRPPAALLDAYFSEPIADDVGAITGEVVPTAGDATLAARYGAARSFLRTQPHLEHPYRPRVVAANLLVRRTAFEQVGGFYEGVRAGEDTDFSWRLQQAGWRLDSRPDAQAEHRYRTTLRELRRQWRGYAAGRAWLARRYDGYVPETAVERAGRRGFRRLRGAPSRPRGAPNVNVSRLERGRYLALDALLSAEELAGLVLSNRPARRQNERASVVFIADRFPVPGDPLAEFARTLDRARVEAAARPDALDPAIVGDLRIEYREDDGVASRAAALALLALRHPVRCAIDVIRSRRTAPSLTALAPAILRLERDPRARVHPLGGEDARAVAGRIAKLAGRSLVEQPSHPATGLGSQHATGRAADPGARLGRGSALGTRLASLSRHARRR